MDSNQVLGLLSRSYIRATHAPAWGNLIAEDGEGIEVPAFTVDQIERSRCRGIEALAAVGVPAASSWWAARLE